MNLGHGVSPYHTSHIVLIRIANNGPSICCPRYGQQTDLSSPPVSMPMMGQEEPVARSILQVAALVGLVPFALGMAETMLLSVGSHGPSRSSLKRW